MIEGKVEQSREWSNAPPTLHLGVVAIEKGVFGSLSTKVINFTFYLPAKSSTSYLVGWLDDAGKVEVVVWVF